MPLCLFIPCLVPPLPIQSLLEERDSITPSPNSSSAVSRLERSDKWSRLANWTKYNPPKEKQNKAKQNNRYQNHDITAKFWGMTKVTGKKYWKANV